MKFYRLEDGETETFVAENMEQAIEFAKSELDYDPRDPTQELIEMTDAQVDAEEVRDLEDDEKLKPLRYFAEGSPVPSLISSTAF
jgi:hypothetical protein